MSKMRQRKKMKFFAPELVLMFKFYPARAITSKNARAAFPDEK